MPASSFAIEARSSAQPNRVGARSCRGKEKIMRSILGLSSAAIVTVLLATAGAGRFAVASPDDCSISGMQGSFACPLNSWTPEPAPVPQQQAAPAAPQQATPPTPQRADSSKGCTPRYELYSSHVKWIDNCPSVSQVP
jgi:hypothetical protein